MKRNLSVTILIILLLISIFFMDLIIAQDNKENSKRNYKIGVIIGGDTRRGKVNGLIDGLYNYGYTKDDFTIIIKNAQEDKEKLDLLARELIEEGVDIIVTTGTHETAAAKKYADDKRIPVVFIGVGCTVELGIVEDKISPSCYVTGVDSHYVELSGKRLEFLKRLVPETKDVLILYNSFTTPFGPSSEILYEAAEKLDVNLEIVSVTNPQEVNEAIKSNHSRFDGIMLMCSLLFETTIDDIVEASLTYKIPIIGVNETQVKKGLLAFYGSTNYREGFQASRLVVNILEGHDPRNIPIETPESLELHINVETAEALGVEIDYCKMTFVDKFVK